MSSYNPGASTTGAGPSPTPDTQTLIGLLGSLMPLLLQIQSQSGGQILQSGAWSPGSYQSGMYQTGLHQPGVAQTPGGPLNPDVSGAERPYGNLAAPSPMIDQQAAISLVEDITADSLRMLSAYLETYAGQHQGLESCVPIVTQAARCFAARDYAQTLGLIWQAYRAITALRAANPQLPPPRVAGVPGTQVPSSTTIN
jgi:hypothetical protein